MQILSPVKCSEWLASHGLPESPYSRPVAPGTIYAQFSIAQCPAAAHIVLGAHSLPPSDGPHALVQVTDWSSFGTQPPHWALSELQDAYPDEWSTFWTGGVAFNSSEAKDLEDLCQFVVAEGLSAYMYVTGREVTIYFWEGELLDLWSPHLEVIESIQQSLCSAGARISGRDDG